MSAQDLTDDCTNSLSGQLGREVPVDELRRFFCGRCKNMQCNQNPTGPRDPMGVRAERQIQRLLHPTIVDPSLPKYQPVVRSSNFEDAREAAEAWDLKARRPAPPDMPDQTVDPSRLAGPRDAAGRPALRALPEGRNAPLPTGTAAKPQGPAVRDARDPWDPGAGGVKVQSGATIRLGSDGRLDPVR